MALKKERKNKYCGCLDNFSTQSRVVKRLGAHLMKIRPLFGWGNGLQMCCRTKCSEIHYFNNYDTDRVKCGLVSFISSGLVRSRSEGATSSGHVRRSFTALGLCHNNRCDLTLRFYPAVASKCMAVTRHTQRQQRGFRWTGANSRHDADDSPTHPRAETKAIAPVMDDNGFGQHQFG